MKAIIYRDEIPLAYGLSTAGLKGEGFEPAVEVTKKFFKDCERIEAEFFEMQDKLEGLYMEARKKKNEN